MRKFIVFSIVLSFVVLAGFGSDLAACGHDGIYLGFGYNQLFMYTPEHRRSTVFSERIKFGPGYGATFNIGYDIPGSRWGIQMPFEWARLKLNKSEWVNSFGSEIEGVLHIKEWQNGLDFHLIFGAGWTYLTEGRDKNMTKGPGIVASAGPGLSYYFTRKENISGAVNLEIPFRFVHYFKDRLSANGTSALAVPIRISMQIGF